jgi:lysozyme family protein
MRTKFKVVAGLALAISACLAALPQAADAAVYEPHAAAVKSGPIPHIKARLWTFTCGNPVPYQYQNATYQTGVADKCLWAEAQELGMQYGYTGPIDGVMGPNSWKGFQSWMKAAGFYAGAIDGVPGPQTYAALQRLAQVRGTYTGPVDGVMGPNSWKGLGYALNRIHFGA